MNDSMFLNAYVEKFFKCKVVNPACLINLWNLKPHTLYKCIQVSPTKRGKILMMVDR